jgi:integrase/ribosomal protein L40E
MIESEKEIRNRAMLAVLYNSGARPHELIGMRLCDVDLTSNPAHITLTSHKEREGRSRTIAILFAVPYLAQYMELIKDRKPTDKLWIGIGHGKNDGAVLTNHGLIQVVARAAQRAGIKRHVVNYIFRHTHLTWCYLNLPLEMAKYRAGHSKNSREASTYTHFAVDESDRAFLKANGIIKEIKPQERSKIVICPRCKNANQMTSTYCFRCGSALSLEVASAQDTANELLGELMKDPALAKRVSATLERRKQMSERR